MAITSAVSDTSTQSLVSR